MHSHKKRKYQMKYLLIIGLTWMTICYGQQAKDSISKDLKFLESIVKSSELQTQIDKLRKDYENELNQLKSKFKLEKKSLRKSYKEKFKMIKKEYKKKKK